MVAIVPVGEGDQEACVRDRLHVREKPSRRDKSPGRSIDLREIGTSMSEQP
jgi:hypothetical protein